MRLKAAAVLMLEITVLSAYAAGGLPQTAPEGLVPLDSLSSPAGGTKGRLLFLYVGVSNTL